MQDKEFDSLFRSKLENFEAEPTSQVWTGISERLDGKTGYRKLVPYLSIAASVLILAAAGIVFIPRTSKNTKGDKPVVKTGLVKTQPVAPAQPAQPSVKEEAVKPATGATNTMAQVRHSNAVRPTVKEPVKQAVEQPAIPEEQVHQPEQLLAAVQQKPESIDPVLPTGSTPLIAKDITDEAPVVTATPAAAASDEPVTTRPKRRVHGIGGLLNTVIAAVDKRKDKIIEFSNTDDDESSTITGVNLGILKFKKEEAK
ncbi:MAG TPA: hypothetical protein VHA56_11420 [Mucilaginibacter sp.]|nr:hypothetical protein [Mucilaginibacter sp.]